MRGMVAEDRIYGALPLTHVFGLASMLMAGLDGIQNKIHPYREMLQTVWDENCSI